MRKVDHEQRRQEVAVAAAHVIARDGLEGLTTRALAKEMGCSIGVLSHYFNSKEDIVIAALNWADQRIDQRVEEVLRDHPSTESFIPVIRAALPLDEASDLEWRVRFNLYAYTLTSKNKFQLQTQERQLSRRMLAEVIRELQNDGKLLAGIDPLVMANIAFDMVIGAAQHLLSLPLEEREDYARYLFDLIPQIGS